MSEGTAVCKDCWKRRSGYLPYYGITCDGCIEMKEITEYGYNGAIISFG